MWYHLYIEDPIRAAFMSHMLSGEVHSSLAHPGRFNAALFTKQDVVTAGTHFYFAPHATEIGIQHGASACPFPTRAQVGGLLAGERGVLARLF
jgi:hypothetical protein